MLFFTSAWWQIWRRGPAPLVDPAPDVEAEVSAPFSGPLGHDWPRDRADVYRVFGDPGVGKVDKEWARRECVTAKNLPGRWNRTAGKLYVHRKAEPYLREALRRAALLPIPVVRDGRPLTALDYITRLGCFNFRHQRHDPSRPLSYHSWGIALDINSEDNAGKYVKAEMEPWDATWVKLWPRGVPRELVHAFESVGWRWGGRWKGKDGFRDPMHFELVA